MTNLDICLEIMQGLFDHWGCGFEEKVYQESWEYELDDRHIFKHRPFIILQWKGHDLSYMQVDLEVGAGDKVIVEMKATSNKLNDKDELQIKHYMKARGVNKGILVNFGTVSADNPKIPDFRLYTEGDKEQ